MKTMREDCIYRLKVIVLGDKGISLFIQEWANRPSYSLSCADNRPKCSPSTKISIFTTNGNNILFRSRPLRGNLSSLRLGMSAGFIYGMLTVAHVTAKICSILGSRSFMKIQLRLFTSSRTRYSSSNTGLFRIPEKDSLQQHTETGDHKQAVPIPHLQPVQGILLEDIGGTGESFGSKVIYLHEIAIVGCDGH